jgi:hypothetical protein
MKSIVPYSSIPLPLSKRRGILELGSGQSRDGSSTIVTAATSNLNLKLSGSYPSEAAEWIS